MKTPNSFNRVPRALTIALALFLVVVLPTSTFAQHYIQTNLVSDTGAPPALPDANLRNAWGLVHSPTSPWWISNNATGTSTVYNASGLPSSNIVINSLVVTVPNAPSHPGLGTPTGVMFNGSPTDFLLAPGRPALFIFVTEDGTISGWNPAVNATHAVIAADSSPKPGPGRDQGALYKGATIAEIDGGKFILAANFRSGNIDAFDSTFKQVRLARDAFHDDRIPRGYAPFNIQGIGPNLYVAYAKQDNTKVDEVAGPGLGFVDVFSPRGKLLARLEHGPVRG